MAVLFAAAMMMAGPGSLNADNGADQPAINLALGKSYTLETPYTVDALFGKTEMSHPDDTGFQLTDGKHGGTVFSDSAYIGRLWQGSRIITIDLGKQSTVQEVYIHMLQDNANGIFFPERVFFSLSNDGTKWQHLEEGISKVPSTERGPVVQKIGIGDINTVSRYVRLEVPVSSWIFMDEIEVVGSEDLTGRKLRPSPKGPKDDTGYPKEGSKASGRMNNQVLLYTGEWQHQPADWISYTKEDLKSLVAYVDRNNEAKDFMFDGFLFLPYGPLPNGANYAPNTALPTDMNDWEHHLDRLFREDRELGALNRAVAEAKTELKERNHKAKVVVTIPYPRTDQGNFGDVDGDGISENLNVQEVGEEQALANRKKVVKWYVDEVYKRWRQADYKELELASFYWYAEFVSRQTSVNEDLLIQWTSGYVHRQGAAFQWIPYYFARGWNDWKRNGFDTALMQPNYMFHNTAEDRLDTIARAAYDHGMGVEIEMNDAVLANSEARDKYYAYLNKGAEYGYMNSFKAFYQQVKTLQQAAESPVPAAREVYDKTYSYLKGTYRP